jgi:hypothetical protein
MGTVLIGFIFWLSGASSQLVRRSAVMIHVIYSPG